MLKELVNLSHHAYYLIGSDPARTELVSTLEKKHKIQTRGNPDFFDRKYETFTIDDARAVKSLAETKPVNESGKKIFVLTMNGITVEAQNALLKLLEEPSEYAHFFLIIPSAHLLLSTVKSRMSFISGKGQGGKSIGNDVVGQENDAELMKGAESFLKLPVAKRLETIKSLMDAIAKEKKTKQDVIDLINALEAAVYAKGGVKKNAQALEAIALSRKYMNDRAPSLKMLLEYVALNA
jgi:DNA polymerase III delta prime subunit